MIIQNNFSPKVRFRITLKFALPAHILKESLVKLQKALIEHFLKKSKKKISQRNSKKKKVRVFERMFEAIPEKMLKNR